MDSDDENLGPATDESYTLSVNSDGSASLTAKSVFGALHGLESFAQLVEAHTDEKVFELYFIILSLRFRKGSPKSNCARSAVVD